MSTATRSTEKRLFVSRVHWLKRSANHHAHLLRAFGGNRVKIIGHRGAWMVRASMPLTGFCEFLSVEAKEDKRK